MVTDKKPGKWKHPNSKKNLQMWGKGQSWNPKGRTPVNKQTKEILKELNTLWYKWLTKTDVERLYLHMMNLPIAYLKSLWEDPEAPMIVKNLAKSLLSSKWFEHMERMLDRSIWKAMQPEEIRQVDWQWRDVPQNITINIRSNENATEESLSENILE